MNSKLKWIQFTGGNQDYVIELIFEGDRHHEIRLDKGMSIERVANALFSSVSDLTSLKDEGDWNKRV